MASALGTVTVVDHVGQCPGSPIFVDYITVVGDADYATGGTSGLLAALRAKTKDSRVIVGALCVAGGGYQAQYLVASDKIIVYGTGAANKAPGTQVDASTDLHATTFGFLVFSK